MTAPILSICVCTLRGAKRLPEGLLSLAGQSAAFNLFEVIVVENEPDAVWELEELVERVRKRGLTIRLVGEPERGLSAARNRGIAESRGQYISFFDDDQVALPRWVEAYLAAISEHSPDILGGNIEPLFMDEAPKEIRQMWGSWSLKHFGRTDRWLNDGEYFLGGNVCVSKNVLAKRKFDTSLGRTNDDQVGGEEWWLGDSRYSRRFVAGAIMLHQVFRERMSPAHVAGRIEGAHRSARLGGYPSGAASVLGGLLANWAGVLRDSGVLLAFSLDVAKRRWRLRRSQP